jgi:hypothetical protein
VTCDHCHTSSFEVDEGNHAKLRAREMMRMVDQINENHFNGNTVVTCNTCHRGSLKPQAAPVPEAENWIKAAQQAPPSPSPAAILARYRKSIGIGDSNPAPALTQSVLLQVATYGGTGAAKQSSIEVLLGGSNMIRLSNHEGQMIRTLLRNGQKVWKNEGQGWKSISEGEASTAFEMATLLAVDQVGDVETANPASEDRVYRQRAFVVPVTSKDGRKSLFFDVDTGVLLKQRIFFSSFYGDGSVDIDYTDYRRFGKFLLPTTFQITNAGGSGLTISHATSRKLNIRLKHSDFDPASE